MAPTVTPECDIHAALTAPVPCRQTSLAAGAYTVQQVAQGLDAVNRVLPAMAALDLPHMLHQLAHRFTPPMPPPCHPNFTLLKVASWQHLHAAIWPGIPASQGPDHATTMQLSTCREAPATLRSDSARRLGQPELSTAGVSSCATLCQVLLQVSPARKAQFAPEGRTI